jgi:hypothetical protein
MGMDGRHELLSGLAIKQLIPANTLTTGNTVNSYNTAQLGGSVDSWLDSDSVLIKPVKGLIIIDVASLTAGTLTISLRDDNAALTNANGDANSNAAFSLTAIDEAGLYLAEFNFDHVFPETYARVVTHADAAVLQRYLSLRAVAAGGTAVFSAVLVLGQLQRGFPANETVLTPTWVSA